MPKKCTCVLASQNPWTPSHFDGGDCPVHGNQRAKKTTAVKNPRDGRGYVIDKDGNKIAHTGIKVWFVMRGTKGKQIEWEWLVSSSGDDLNVVSNRGNQGRNPKKSTFFTRAQAIQDWRWRNSEESREHVTVISDVGDKLKEFAAKLKNKIRVRGAWQDL